MNNNDIENINIMFFNTLSLILRKDYNIELKNVLNNIKKHLEKEYEHYDCKNVCEFEKLSNDKQNRYRKMIIDKIGGYYK